MSSNLYCTKLPQSRKLESMKMFARCLRKDHFETAERRLTADNSISGIGMVRFSPPTHVIPT